MTVIHKKTWPGFFEKIRTKKKWSEVRLADFEVKVGDVISLDEYDPIAEIYSGRQECRIVKQVHFFNPLQFYGIEAFKSTSYKGMLLIEFENDTDKELAIAKTELGRFKRIVGKACEGCEEEYGCENCDRCGLQPLRDASRELLRKDRGVDVADLPRDRIFRRPKP